MSSQNQIVELTQEVNRIAQGKVSQINDINREATFLAINASIEAAHAGEAGRGFAVVASHLKDVSAKIGTLTTELNSELTGLGSRMVTMLHSQDAQRLADLSANMIEIIDRNLYERSCDVRWWATDAAVTACAAQADAAAVAHACERLGVILNAYTVYLDLWIVDLDGKVIANGRPQRYSVAGQHSAAGAEWFQNALKTASGDDYTVADIEVSQALGGAQVATYATAIRANGATHGPVTGVLAVFFDWGPQAKAVLGSVRMSDEEKANVRCMLLDSSYRVLASSDGKGVLSERFGLKRADGQKTGYYEDGGATVAFAETPGYETYKGLGWLGAIVRNARK